MRKTTERNRFFQGCVRFLHDEDSPTFLEYGLLITLIALVAIVAITVFGGSVSELFEDGNDAFP